PFVLPFAVGAQLDEGWDADVKERLGPGGKVQRSPGADDQGAVGKDRTEAQFHVIRAPVPALPLEVVRRGLRPLDLVSFVAMESGDPPFLEQAPDHQGQPAEVGAEPFAVVQGAFVPSFGSGHAGPLEARDGAMTNENWKL